jgi:hypothetical protein
MRDEEMPQEIEGFIERFNQLFDGTHYICGDRQVYLAVST